MGSIKFKNNPKPEAMMPLDEALKKRKKKGCVILKTPKFESTDNSEQN
jgi:hypothetical protein